MITLWTDGSANPNPGPGGYAVIRDGEPVALGREAKSTNIRMEACALIAAMRYADGRECKIMTDSEFWVNVLTKWAPEWEAQEWTKKGGIKNLELVLAAYELYVNSNVTLSWTRGHVGTENNEKADYWAGKARKGQTYEDLEVRVIKRPEGEALEKLIEELKDKISRREQDEKSNC